MPNRTHYGTHYDGTPPESMSLTNWAILQIDWPAVAKDAGKPVGTVKKQWSRLNIKMGKSVPFDTSDSDKDADKGANKDANKKADKDADEDANLDDNIDVE